MIKKILFLFSTILLVFVSQMILSESISVQGIFPNLFLLATVFFAIEFGALSGECMGFVLGIAADGMAISLFGSQMFALTLIGYGVGRLKGKIDEAKVLAQVGIVFFVFLLYAWVLYLLESLFGGNAERFGMLGSFYQAFYTCLASPLIFLALAFWKRIFSL